MNWAPRIRSFSPRASPRWTRAASAKEHFWVMPHSCSDRPVLVPAVRAQTPPCHRWRGVAPRSPTPELVPQPMHVAKLLIRFRRRGGSAVVRALRNAHHQADATAPRAAAEPGVGPRPQVGSRRLALIGGKTGTETEAGAGAGARTSQGTRRPTRGSAAADTDRARARGPSLQVSGTMDRAAP